jgi:MFS family permease
MSIFNKNSILSIPLIVAALGYFVDIYDLVLFSIIRKPSLASIGVTDFENVGLFLINVQMVGMLLGGIFWGIIGDKKGRLKVLFGSILMYSLANLANAFVTDVNTYAVLRFIAGFGLAGELGAGITLVSEILPKEKRGWGTTIVATVGVSGAILAGVFGLQFSWQTCYIIGGLLGLALLVLRVGVYESGMYKQAANDDIPKGNILMLFNNKERFFTYAKCILVGLPIWYCIGLLVTFSPEFGKLLGIQGDIKPAFSIMYFYAGVTLGDLGSGVISQLIKSRKKVLIYFIAASFIVVLCYFRLYNIEVQTFYYFLILMGFVTGYWAVIITSASEQFGTNIRATATTSVPNFIRASLVLITILYKTLIGFDIPKLNAAQITGICCCGIAIAAAFFLKETYGKELDYYEK